MIEDAKFALVHHSPSWTDPKLTERTSKTHPLLIATHSSPSWQGGQLGITFCPGKKQSGAMTGSWNRDLATDLDAISAWRATDVVSLIESHEFETLGVLELPELAGRQTWQWHHLPMVDEQAPSQQFLQSWDTAGPALCKRLREGARILVHCKGGLGRAGTVSALLLVGSGAVSNIEDAISLVREIRGPMAIDPPQETFLRNWVK